MTKKRLSPNFSILGIETTCDETAAAVLQGGRKLLSNVVYSQVSLHKKFSGVVPEIASRAHSEKIAYIIAKSLEQASLQKPPDAIAFASGPGLPGALLVGKMAAQTLSKIYAISYIGVNHLEGHLFACEFSDDEVKNTLKFPLIALIVSGGHSELWYVSGYGKYKILGATRDDAAGEAFDKIAKLLKLGYPGGPAVEKYALLNKSDPVKFPRPFLKGGFDFSFSGLKTSVSYYLRDNKKIDAPAVCDGFQQAVVDTLVFKAISAAKHYNVKNIVVGGGVSANAALREGMQDKCNKNGMRIMFSQKKFCSDNAAMIALAGYKKMALGAHIGDLKNINPQLKIKNWTFK